jgi:hypothetical protein
MNTIKKILREASTHSNSITCKKCGWKWNKSDSSKNDLYKCHKCNFDNSPKPINEELTRNQVRNFINDFCWFISANISHIHQEAKDEKSKSDLANMLKSLRQPVINGKSFFQIISLNNDELFNKDFIKAVLEQIRLFLPYIKKHIIKCVKDGENKSGWLSTLNNLEGEYRNIVSQPKTVNESAIKKLLREYIQNEMISLKQYFSLTDEQKINSLPEEYSWFFDDFLVEEDIDFEKPLDSYDDELEGYELLAWLYENNVELYKQYGKYLFDKIESHELPIDDSEYPAWSFFGSPSLVKNQWLIHFTDYAEQIGREGFKRGVDEMTKLGLTTHLSEFDKKYGGYNFAYLINDYVKHARDRHGFKYGSEAVIFNASGLKIWHYGDDEPQVIFYGNTARNIIPVVFHNYDDTWCVKSIITENILYKNEKFDNVVKWVIENYNQYRKHLCK